MLVGYSVLDPFYVFVGRSRIVELAAVFSSGRSIWVDNWLLEVSGEGLVMLSVMMGQR